MRLTVWTYGLLLAALLSGCHSHADRAERRAERGRTLKNSELFVVGKVELIPPLRPEEQDLKTVGSGRLKNRVYVFLSDRFIDMQNLGMGGGKHAALVDFGKPFTVKRRSSIPLYYSGGMAWMQSAASYSGYMNRRTTVQTDHLYLPSPYTFAVEPADKAIYIGTWRYHRNEFNQIKKIEYVDEYRQFVGDTKATLRKVTPRKAESR